MVAVEPLEVVLQQQRMAGWNWNPGDSSPGPFAGGGDGSYSSGDLGLTGYGGGGGGSERIQHLPISSIMGGNGGSGIGGIRHNWFCFIMFDNKKDYFFITGLPRTGSTLLTSTKSKHPCCGNSPVSQMMFECTFLLQKIVMNNLKHLV